MAEFVNLELHGLFLGLSEAELLLLLALSLRLELRQAIKKPIFVRNEWEVGNRSSLGRALINIIPVEDLVVLVDLVQDLEQKGRISRLLTQEQAQQFLQLADVLTSRLPFLGCNHNLLDYHLFRRWCNTHDRSLKVPSVRAEDLAGSDSLHEF